MKTYTITVNGNVYDVTVEEGTAGAAAPAPAPAAPKAAPAPKPAPAAPKAAPAPAQQAAPAPAPAAGSAGSVQAVKAGDSIVVLEAMKMEIPVVAPQDGTVASINVTAGQAVESGDVLATMN